jgi:hypothetical protein
MDATRFRNQPDSELKNICDIAYKGMLLKIEEFFRRILASCIGMFRQEDTGQYLYRFALQWEKQDMSQEIMTEVELPKRFRELVN